MTPKQSVTIDFSEIHSIEARCPCGGVLVIPLPKLALDSRVKCPGCGKYLWDSGVDKKFELVQSIFSILSNWQSLDCKEVRLTFSLTEAGPGDIMPSVSGK